MKNVIFVLAIVFVFCHLAVAEGIFWHTNPETAFREAEMTGKRIFVDAWKPGCSWCEKLEKETFTNESFIEIAGKFVLLKVNAPDYPDFKTKYNITKYPTMLFLNSKGTEIYSRVIGFKTAVELVPIMKKALESPAREATWYTDIQAAFADAKASNRLVFVDFYTTWCSWCKKLEEETYPDAQFQAIAPKFVLLKVDAEKEVAFATQYKVRVYPTLLFLKPDGQEVKRIKGFLPANELVPIMEQVLKDNPLVVSENREAKWYTDIQAAFADAKASKRLIFVDFYTTWCSWCKKLEQETYPDPKFQAIASKFVLLKVDAEKEVAFATKYTVRVYPTLIFLKADGQEVKRIKGFLPANELVPIMEQVLQQNPSIEEAK